MRTTRLTALAQRKGQKVYAKISNSVGRTFVARWIRAYRAHIIKITTSGYIPKPNLRMWKIVRAFFRLWCFIQIGKVRVVGAENFNAPGRVIFCANHGSLLDAQVLFPIAPRPLRTMGAYEILRKFCGLVGLVMTSIGVFAVDRSNGATVIGPATDLLVSGESLAMAPEAKISPTGDLLTFKHGAAVIAKAAYDRLMGKERVGIVPVHIHYHKRHAASALNYGRMWLRWRGGVTVTVLPPIWINDLADQDPDHVILLVRDAIAAVQASWQTA